MENSLAVHLSYMFCLYNIVVRDCKIKLNEINFWFSLPYAYFCSSDYFFLYLRKGNCETQAPNVQTIEDCNRLLNLFEWTQFYCIYGWREDSFTVTCVTSTENSEYKKKARHSLYVFVVSVFLYLILFFCIYIGTSYCPIFPNIIYNNIAKCTLNSH